MLYTDIPSRVSRCFSKRGCGPLFPFAAPFLPAAFTLDPPLTLPLAYEKNGFSGVGFPFTQLHFFLASVFDSKFFPPVAPPCTLMSPTTFIFADSIAGFPFFLAPRFPPRPSPRQPPFFPPPLGAPLVLFFLILLFLFALYYIRDGIARLLCSPRPNV